jgi:hypothetical protein
MAGSSGSGSGSAIKRRKIDDEKEMVQGNSEAKEEM